MHPLERITCIVIGSLVWLSALAYALGGEDWIDYSPFIFIGALFIIRAIPGRDD